MATAVRLGLGVARPNEYMAGGEFTNSAAHRDQRLHLGRDVEDPIAVPTHVEGHDTDRVPRHHVEALVQVPEDEGEDGVQMIEQPDAVLPVECEDDLAVRGGPERIGFRQLLPQLTVVVNLTVHGQHGSLAWTVERLRTARRVDDGEALVHEHTARGHVHPRPVGPTVALEPGQAKRADAVRLGIAGNAEDGED